jgi:hypothetical protein
LVRKKVLGIICQDIHPDNRLAQPNVSIGVNFDDKGLITLVQSVKELSIATVVLIRIPSHDTYAVSLGSDQSSPMQSANINIQQVPSLDACKTAGEKREKLTKQFTELCDILNRHWSDLPWFRRETI